MTSYATAGRVVQYRMGVCDEYTVTRSMLDNPETALRVTIRQWHNPTPWGPEGSISLTAAHGSVTGEGGLLKVLGNWFGPPGSDIPSAIQAAEHILKEINS